MSEVLGVFPGHLLMSAVRTQAHRENVHVTHVASDARIDAAVTGRVGSSQATMLAKAGHWVTPVLSGLLFDHAVNFHQGGYHTAEHVSLAQVVPGGPESV